MKTCTRCGQEKPQSEYYRQKSCKSGFRPHCKACNTQISKKGMREWNLKKRGLTESDYDNLIARQSGCCAICGVHVGNNLGYRLSIDHDHVSGEVRGLLCGKCNVGLGYFGDNAGLLQRAASYVLGSVYIR